VLFENSNFFKGKLLLVFIDRYGRNVIESELLCCNGVNDDLKKGVTFEVEVGSIEAYPGDFSRDFADIFCPRRYGSECMASNDGKECLYSLSSSGLRDLFFPDYEFKGKPLHKGYSDYQKKGIK
jgi:hypothetical protein